MKKQSRQSLENRAGRMGLRLTEASTHAKMEAASRNQRIPRWELSDGKWQNSIRGFTTLEEVATDLDQREITNQFH